MTTISIIVSGNMATALASQLQPVASELAPAPRETSAVERGRSRTGERR
jgi:hypothetical protein